MKNKVLIEKTTFKVDEVNKVIICILKCNMQLDRHPAWYAIEDRMFRKRVPFVDYLGRFDVKAKAKCRIDDKFDVKIGKKIAEERAKVKMFNISSRVYKCCAESILNFVKECNKYSEACKQAMMIESNRVLKLIE